MKLFVAMTASAMLFAGAALAEDAPGGPKIKGGVEMNIEAGEDISAAVGNKSTAAQELGDINAGDITGDVEMGIAADGDIAAAVGNESCASQKVGSIGGEGSDCE
ncbi:MAG: hypothetical protein ACPG80_01975 [Rickettsiales bacterium]